MTGRRLHARALATATGVALAISATTALAAPFAGTGHAAIGGETDGLKARGQALERARKAALEAAIDQLGAADPGARKQVLQNPGAWTGSYRVLQQSDDGATATAVVSVEIDTARLTKSLAGAGATSTPTGGLPPLLPSLVVQAKGCPDGLEAGLRRGLIAAGAVRDVAAGSAGPVLTASLECRAGTVKYPRAAVVRVAARWSTEGLPEAAIGVGEDEAAATADAAARLAGSVQDLSARTGSGVRLQLAAPWPAARVRRLERALRESVVGVQAVAVAAVASDGSVTLQIDGSLTAEELHARLAAVTVPGATLVVGEVDGSHVVHASLQASNKPAAPEPGAQ